MEAHRLFFNVSFKLIVKYFSGVIPKYWKLFRALDCIFHKPLVGIYSNAVCVTVWNVHESTLNKNVTKLGSECGEFCMRKVKACLCRNEYIGLD